MPDYDWRPDFILSLVSACAWPVTVLFLAFLLRRETGRLLGRLTQVKYKDMEANFHKEIREAKRRAPSVSTQEEPPKLEAARPEELSYVQIRERLVRLLDISPKAAIADAWSWVEQATGEAARHLHTDPPGFIDEHRAIVERLVEEGTFNRSAIEQFDSLRRMRNDAVHTPGFPIDADEAERYVDLALQLSTDIFHGLAEEHGRRSTTIE